MTPRRWRRSAVVAAAVAVTVTALYVATPWLAARLAPRLAEPLGLDELHLDVGRPGLSGIAVHELTLSRGRVHVAATGGRVTYRLRQLVAGRIDGARFRHAVVTVHAEAAAGRQSGAEEAGQPADLAALFAALPVNTLVVDDVAVAVPTMSFQAAGRLAIEDGGADVHLDGSSPEAARRLALDARASADGSLHVELGERGVDDQAPLLAVSSLQSGPMVQATGTMALHGFAFDLAAALAGLPPGDGRLDGAFTVASPWPPAQSWDPALLRATASLTGRWRSREGSWAVTAVAADGQLRDGVVGASLRSTVEAAGQRLRLRMSVDRLAAEGTGGGTLLLWHDGATIPGPPGGASDRPAASAVAPGSPAGSGQPLAELAWTLASGALSATGRYRLAGASLKLAAGRAGLPAGSGVLTGEVAVSMPWPPPADPRTWRPLKCQGSLQGEWQADSGGPGARITAGHWQLAGDELSGALRGVVSVQGMNVTAALELGAAALTGRALSARGTLGLGSAVRLPFTARHDLDAGRGSLSLAGKVTVDKPLAADLVKDWSLAFDVTAGTVAVDGHLDWSEGAPRGTLQLGLDGVATHYADYGLAGVAGTLTFSGSAADWSLAPSALTARSAETGVTVEDVSTRVAWSGDVVTFGATTARLLGGSARTDGFAYRLDTGTADLVVVLTDLDLAHILALEGKDVSGAGSLDGTLPVQVRDGLPSIVAGRVQARPPGGVIRVSSAIAGGAGQPGLDFALRALEDFRYSTLSADVGYAASGDLSLAVHLEGSNPTIQEGRAIHYNLTLNENVPTLLKSLRLQDDVTRRIEHRLKH